VVQAELGTGEYIQGTEQSMEECHQHGQRGISVGSENGTECARQSEPGVTRYGDTKVVQPGD
jgi:hypothetical protein